MSQNDKATVKDSLRVQSGGRRPSFDAPAGSQFVTGGECSSPVSAQVAALERKAEEFRGLCGEIIATLVVNRERGLLDSADNEKFDELIQGWKARMDSANNKRRCAANSHQKGSNDV